MRYRLIKAPWAKDEGVPGQDSFDGDDLSEDFLKEKNALGYGIFYFPNYNSKPIPKDEYTSGRHIDVWHWVYVDMDLKDGVYATKEAFLEKLVGFEVTPTKVLASGNGVHAYWRIKDLTRELFCELQLRLIKHFNTDKSIWTTLRCMRLEGYYNTKKKDEYKMAEAEHWSEEEYTYARLSEHLPTLDEVAEKKIMNHLRKIDGLEPEIDLGEIDIDGIPEKFQKLLDKSQKVQDLFLDDKGDRSKNAYALAALLFEKDFDKKEAIAVLANSPKALSKGASRLEYAVDLIDKIFMERTKFVVQSAAARGANTSTDRRKGKPVHGPSYFDCLHRKWRTQQVLGLVGGSGIGKSTVTLDMFKSILENNPESDDICVYFNLEMTDWEVIEKWQALTDNDSKLAERLFVVSNEDDDGNPRNINLQQIVWFCRDIAKNTGKRVIAVAIDHIGVINPTIDIRKKPDFGMLGDMDGAYGDFRSIGLRKMPQLLKSLAKQLDAFVIVQSQTTKAKGGDGDSPLGVDAAYGAAQFEQYMDYVMTVWQPLRRVHHKTDLRILGWQYAKIRSKHKNDEVDTYDERVLNVDINTGRLGDIPEGQDEEFKVLNKEASILRKKADKKEEVEYKRSPGIKKLKKLLAVK